MPTLMIFCNFIIVFDAPWSLTQCESCMKKCIVSRTELARQERVPQWPEKALFDFVNLVLWKKILVRDSVFCPVYGFLLLMVVSKKYKVGIFVMMYWFICHEILRSARVPVFYPVSGSFFIFLKRIFRLVEFSWWWHKPQCYRLVNLWQ